MGNITKGSLFVAFFFTLISRTQLVLFYLLVFFPLCLHLDYLLSLSKVFIQQRGTQYEKNDLQ
jgi:hypothetical protein